MIRCDPQALTALFFDELAPDAAAALQRHAHACPGCSQTLEALREDRERLMAPRGTMTSLDVLFRGVEARLSAKPEPRRARWQLLPGLVPFTGAGLALLLAFFSLEVGASAPRHQGPLAIASGDAIEASTLVCWADVTGSDGAPAGLDDAADLDSPAICLSASPGTSAPGARAF